MNSYEFEVTCKNEIINILAERYNIKAYIQQLHLVWFGRVLNNKRCLIIDSLENQRYYDCTYINKSGKLHIEVFEKKFDLVVKDKNLSSDIKEENLAPKDEFVEGIKEEVIENE